MFCVECGTEGPTVGGLCATCFARKHPLVTPPPHLDAARCRRCGAFRLASGWSRIELDVVIPRLLQERIPPLPPFTRVLFTHATREEDPSNYSLTVKASGRHEAFSQVQDFHVRLRIKPSLCDLCQKQAGEYFEGILQVRGDGRELTPAESRGVRDLVRARVERGREESRDFISKIEEMDGGLDIFVSTNALGARLARELADSFGGTVTSSPKLFGQRGGKELYRVTSLVRLPAFAVGDVVRHKGSVAEVVAVKPFVELRDLASGETRRFKPKDLRGLRRVDAERFETAIRRDEAGRATVVHPDSGAERPLDLRGAMKATASVVWTRDGAYLSALPAEGSKD